MRPRLQLRNDGRGGQCPREPRRRCDVEGPAACRGGRGGDCHGCAFGQLCQCQAADSNRLSEFLVEHDASDHRLSPSVSRALTTANQEWIIGRDIDFDLCQPSTGRSSFMNANPPEGPKRDITAGNTFATRQSSPSPSTSRRRDSSAFTTARRKGRSVSRVFQTMSRSTSK